MPWGPVFREGLRASRIRPRFQLEVAPVSGYLPGVALNLHSHAGRSGHAPAITLAGSSVRSGVLRLGDWSCTVGELSLGIRSAVDIRPRVPRGALVQLMMGLDGFAEHEYERVFLGQVQDVRQLGGQQWQLTARSMLGALASRFTNTSTQTQLFYDLTSTILTANYDPGVPTDPISVASTTGLNKLSTGSYLIRIQPDSGDPFFLTATGKTANTISGLSTTGQLGTTEAFATSGNAVTLCAYLPQHPVEAALTVLTSLGGGNGDYDLGPASWGIGLPFGYVDIDDALITKSIVSPGAGVTTWDIYSLAEAQNPLTWLQSVLQPAGIWLADRQGCVTVRAAQDIGQFEYGVEFIHDKEIVAVRNYSAWDTTQPVEYGLVSIQTASGGVTVTDQHLDSRPSIEEKEIALSYIFQNEAAWQGKVQSRVVDYYHKVGEVFELECIGFRLAHLAPGDHVIVSSRYLKSRYAFEGLSVVVSVQPNWFGASTTLRVVHIQDQAQFA